MKGIITKWVSLFTLNRTKYFNGDLIFLKDSYNGQSSVLELKI